MRRLRPQKSKTYWGLWPDSIAGDNGPGKDIRTNYKGDKWSEASYPFVYKEEIDQAQWDKLKQLVAQDITYGGPIGCYTTNCASFAAETFSAVTGTYVDSNDTGGWETPRKLGQSIRALNGGQNMPSGEAPVEDPDADGSSSTSSFPSSCPTPPPL